MGCFWLHQGQGSSGGVVRGKEANVSFVVDPLKYGRSWPWGRRSPYAGSLQWDAFVGFQKLTAETTWLKSPLEANPISLRSFSHTSQLLPRNTPYNRLLLGSLYPTGSPPGWRPAIFHCSSWKTYMLPNSGSADSSRRGPPHSLRVHWLVWAASHIP